MKIPTGKFYGSLPSSQFLIKGDIWEVIETKIIDSQTIDILLNTRTNEKKSKERYKFLNYLLAN